MLWLGNAGFLKAIQRLKFYASFFTSENERLDSKYSADENLQLEIQDLKMQWLVLISHRWPNHTRLEEEVSFAEVRLLATTSAAHCGQKQCKAHRETRIITQPEHAISSTSVKSKIYRRHGFRKLGCFFSNHPCSISPNDMIVQKTKAGNELNKGKNAP